MGGGPRHVVGAIGVLGLSLLLSLVGFASIQAPTSAAAAVLNPYGFSTWAYQNRISSSGVKWVRDQRDWSSIETSPGVYDFVGLDQDVAVANRAGVHISLPIQDAPNFRKTLVCNGVNLFPGPNEISTFAGIVANRYDGRNGHGWVDSFEIGNEEYDGYWGGTWANTLPCRSANVYGPLLKAGYQAVKAQSPNALVGMFGMWWMNTGHIQSYMTWLYQNGYGRYMDFANFHFYPGGNPANTSGDVPSFDLEWQTIHNVQAAYGDGGKPIWCTEVGWAVSSVGQGGNPIVTLAQQAQYLQYVLDSSRISGGVMQRVFIYEISDTGYDGMNIYPPSGPLPSYAMLQAYIAQYPAWGVAAPPPTPTPTPAPTTTPAPTQSGAPSPSPSLAAGPTPARSGSPGAPAPSGKATALKPAAPGTTGTTRVLPAEVRNVGPLGIANLITVVRSMLGSEGMLIVLWLALGLLFWVVLRVLTVISLGRRPRILT